MFSDNPCHISWPKSEAEDEAERSGQSNAPGPASLEAEAGGAFGSEVAESIGGQLRSLMLMLGVWLSLSELAKGSQLSILFID